VLYRLPLLVRGSSTIEYIAGDEQRDLAASALMAAQAQEALAEHSCVLHNHGDESLRAA
jgi:hypothetical protein